MHLHVSWPVIIAVGVSIAAIVLGARPDRSGLRWLGVFALIVSTLAAMAGIVGSRPGPVIEFDGNLYGQGPGGPDPREGDCHPFSEAASAMDSERTDYGEPQHLGRMTWFFGPNYYFVPRAGSDDAGYRDGFVIVEFTGDCFLVYPPWI